MKALEHTTPKSSRLKIVIVILAVLLVLSSGGLAARYAYLRFSVQTRETVTAPGNLISEEAAESKNMAEAEMPQAEKLSSGSRKLEAAELRLTSSGNSAEAGDGGADERRAVDLELYAGRQSENHRFEVKHMFPGDTVTQSFHVTVHHDADLELFFKTEITEQKKNLGDVLHIKVTHLETAKVLCDASFSEVNGREISELLKKNAAGETLATYQVDVSLDTSVGNEYQEAALKADFEWYVKKEDTSGGEGSGGGNAHHSQSGTGLTPPKTGDMAETFFWSIAAISSVLFLVTLLLGYRRKGAGRHE